MSAQIGTATDYRDLLDKLRLFLTTDATLVGLGQEWVQKRWNTTATTQELILMGKGLGGTDQIYVGINSDQDIPSDWFNWHLNAYIGYNPALTFLTQPGTMNTTLGSLQTFHLWNSSIPYWFVANGRRFVVVVRINTRYFMMHQGLLTPYSTPVQTPYPLCVMGNGVGISTTRWSAVPQGRASSTFIGASWSGSPQPKVFFSYELIPSDSGAYLLLPVYMSTNPSFNNTNQRYEYVSGGEMEGVFKVPGLANVSENIITESGVDHLVFQDGTLTSLSDYWAVRLN